MKNIIFPFFILLLTSCAIEFQVASQRTAIEEQILGAYAEMDQELVLMSSVRALDAQGEAKTIDQNDWEKRATAAKQNQQFNSDDLLELKNKELIGETADGEVSILPKNLGRVSKASQADLELAKLIVSEENRDRATIWQRVIQKSPDLHDKDLQLVKENYHNQMLEKLDSGMWYQNEKAEWVKKEK